MNIALWILQVLLALYAAMGGIWRFLNFDAVAKMPSVAALPYGAWALINLFEIACAVGLIHPALLGRKKLPWVAGALAVEMLLLTILHAYHAGLQPSATNPATYTAVLAVLAALLAWGRKRKPL